MATSSPPIERTCLIMGSGTSGLLSSRSPGRPWREDLRSATGEVTLKDGVLRIPQKKRAVVYRLQAGRVLRSTGVTLILVLFVLVALVTLSLSNGRALNRLPRFLTKIEQRQVEKYDRPG